MEYLKLQASFTTSMAWRLARPSARGTAVSLLMFAARSGLAGRIPGCIHWSEDQWRAAADVEGEYVVETVEQGLAKWEGDDLVLEGFDHHGFATLQTQRQQGHHGLKGALHGPKGGRPKTPSGGSTVSPPVQTSPVQTSPLPVHGPPAPDPNELFHVEPKSDSLSKPVEVVRNVRPPISDIDQLRHAGAFIGRDEAGAWQLLVDTFTLERLVTTVRKVVASGERAFRSTVAAALGHAAPPTDEYRVIDGQRVRVIR